MKIGEFSLNIDPDRPASGYYMRMKDGEGFRVLLGNYSDRKGVGILRVQGVHIGSIRIPAGRVDVAIDGPTNGLSHFIFKKEDSRDKEHPHDYSGGVVSCVFYLSAKQEEKTDEARDTAGLEMHSSPFGAPDKAVKYKKVTPITKDDATRTLIELVLVHDYRLEEEWHEPLRDKKEETI